MAKTSFFYNNLINIIGKELSAKTGVLASKPLQVSIQPNERCNARCLMCDCWKEKQDYMDSKEIINTLKQLKTWIKDGFFVQIAGGEPLIFRGIFDIFSFCSENGIICKISTNGIALNPKNCDRIIRSGLSYLSVSLDSHIPEIHDKFRGVKNTFETAVNGIKYLAQNSNLTLGISSVLMKDNIATFDQSVEYFLQLPIHRLLIQPIRIWTENISIEKWNQYEYWINNLDALKSFTDYLLLKREEDRRILNTRKDILDWYEYFESPASLASNAKKKCTIGYDRLSISYKGDVYLGCGRFGAVGNIKQDNIKELWYSEKANRVRKGMMKCNYPCTSNCYKELSLRKKVVKAKVFIKSGLFNN